MNKHPKCIRAILRGTLLSLSLVPLLANAQKAKWASEFEGRPVLSSPLVTLPNGSTTNATWNGASGSSNNWNDLGNWVNGDQPLGGNSNATINYGSTAGPGNRTTSNNDYGDDLIQLQQILFTSAAPSYTLTGSRIKLFDAPSDGITGKIQNDSANLQTISFTGPQNIGMLVESNFEINPVQGDIAITNTVLLDFNNPTISVYGNNGRSLTLTVRSNSSRRAR